MARSPSLLGAAALRSLQRATHIQSCLSQCGSSDAGADSSADGGDRADRDQSTGDHTISVESESESSKLQYLPCLWSQQCAQQRLLHSLWPSFVWDQQRRSKNQIFGGGDWIPSNTALGGGPWGGGSKWFFIRVDSRVKESEGRK